MGKKRRRRDVLGDLHSMVSLVEQQGQLHPFIRFFETGRTFRVMAGYSIQAAASRSWNYTTQTTILQIPPHLYTQRTY